MKLGQKVAVVTGASCGIGMAITAHLLARGYRVWGQYFSQSTFAQAFPSKDFSAVRADLTDPESAREMMAKITAEGPIDALINLVGPLDHRPLNEVSPAAWRSTVDLNLHTTFHAIYFARDALLRSRGHIINFTYAGAEHIRAAPEMAAYAAAKAGVAVLTKSLAAELAEKGIKVNAIAPGWMEEAGREGAKRDAIAASLPMRRLGNPEEVAELVEWLLEKSPNYLTGATIGLGGGFEF